MHSKRPRTFRWIFFSKSFVFNLVWYLSEDFWSIVEIFPQNCQKWILRVQRYTLTKTLSWLCETIFEFGQGNVWFPAENLQPCYQICSFVSRWPIGRIVLKEFSLFFDFFRTSSDHFLLFSLYHSRHGGPNWIPPAKRNISVTKNFCEKTFCPFRTMSAIFEHSLKSFRHVVKTTVYLFIGALWERLSFFETFANVFCVFER